MMKKIENISLFDFDGTIIKGDSVKLFYKLHFGICWILEYYLSFTFIKFLVTRNFNLIERKRRLKIRKIIESNSFKEKEFFELLKSNYFEDINELFNRNIKYKIVVVTGSYYELLQLWGKENDIPILATSCFSDDDILTFEKKVKKIKDVYPKAHLINAYGNSSSDFPMLEISKKRYFRKTNGDIKEI